MEGLGWRYEGLPGHFGMKLEENWIRLAPPLPSLARARIITLDVRWGRLQISLSRRLGD